MNTSPRHHDPAAEEQAALWAARLDGSVLSADQRIALDDWLAADAAHRTLLSQYCQFSADLEQQMPLLAGIKELSDGTCPARYTAQPQPWSRRPLMAGVMLTAAAAVALAFWLARPRSQFENIATPVAHRSALTLVDGTRVELNAQTSLAIEIDGQGRRVRLASGEAFFAVQPDASRPFTVETPAGSVRVTGTQFNVRAESAALLEVMVLEGSVLARPTDAEGRAHAPRALTTGDRLSFGPEGMEVSPLSRAALDDALAWRQGYIVFKDVPLSTALARFARYHGRGITVTPDAADRRIGGRYSLDDLDGFFTALEMFLPTVQVSHQGNGTVQVGLRSAR